MNFQLVEGYMEMPWTSAGGSIGNLLSGLLIRVGGALSVPGTASVKGLVKPKQAWVLETQTNSGVQGYASQSSGSAIMELRRLSGLTWEQLARLFGVVPRSLHFWVSGKPLTPAHEERVNRLLATMHKLDRGSARENRALLLGVRDDGMLPFDLLVAEQYEQVLTLLGLGQALVRPKLAALSEEARRARQPLPPEELVGALQDRPHKDPGNARVPRVVRSRK